MKEMANRYSDEGRVDASDSSGKTLQLYPANSGTGAKKHVSHSQQGRKTSSKIYFRPYGPSRPKNAHKREGTSRLRKLSFPDLPIGYFPAALTCICPPFIAVSIVTEKMRNVVAQQQI